MYERYKTRITNFYLIVKDYDFALWKLFFLSPLFKFLVLTSSANLAHIEQVSVLE